MVWKLIIFVEMKGLFSEVAEIQARFEFKKGTLDDRLSRIETNILLDFQMSEVTKKVLLDSIRIRRERMLDEMFRGIINEINSINSRNTSRIWYYFFIAINTFSGILSKIFL